MPLAAATFASAMLKLTNPLAPGFVGFPTDPASTAAKWANVAAQYFATMVVPVGGSAVAGTLGVTAFVSAMTATLGPPGAATAIPALAAGLDAMAGAIALALTVPPPPGAPVASLCVPPPPGLSAALGIAVAPFLVGTMDPVGPANAIAAAVDTWAHTGTFLAPVLPVPGVLLLWG